MRQASRRPGGPSPGGPAAPPVGPRPVRTRLDITLGSVCQKQSVLCQRDEDPWGRGRRVHRESGERLPRPREPSGSGPDVMC